MYKKLLVSVLLTTALVAGCGPKAEDKQTTNGDQIDTVMPLQDQGSAPGTSSENGNVMPNANVAEPTQVPPTSATPDAKTPATVDGTTATTPATGSDAQNPGEVKAPTDKMDNSKIDPNGASKDQNDLHKDINKGLDAATSGDHSVTTNGDK
jgi:hypothetical protein